MNRDGSRNELGLVRIHRNVVSSISSIAALEIEGVKKISASFKSNLFSLFGQKNFMAIKVDIVKNEEVRVEIPLVIKYGYNIPETCARVQENVRLALEKMGNLSVRDINVNVKGIERG